MAAERGQQRRHGDERAQVRGNAARAARAPAARWRGSRRVTTRLTSATATSMAGTHSEHREQQQPAPEPTPMRRARQRDGQQAGATQRDGADIAADAERPMQARPAKALGDGVKPIAASKSWPAARDQIDSRDRSGARRPAPASKPGAPRRLHRRDGRRRVRYASSRAPGARWRCDRDCASGNPCPGSRCRRRSTSSTRLTRSNSSVQSTSEIRRMLVMMLRTVTLAATCRWCTSRTTRRRRSVPARPGARRASRAPA